MTLANEMIQVSGVQFYNASPVYCTVCSPPQVKSPSITISFYRLSTLFHSPTPSPSSNLHTVVCVCEFSFCLIPSPFRHNPAKTPSSLISASLFSVYESISILFVSLFYSLGPHISEITWYLSFSDWLISLSIMLSRSIYAVTKGKILAIILQ